MRLEPRQKPGTGGGAPPPSLKGETASLQAYSIAVGPWCTAPKAMGEVDWKEVYLKGPRQ